METTVWVYVTNHAICATPDAVPYKQAAANRHSKRMKNNHLSTSAAYPFEYSDEEEFVSEEDTDGDDEHFMFARNHMIVAQFPLDDRCVVNDYESMFSCSVLPLIPNAVY